VGGEGWQHIKVRLYQVDIASTSLISLPISLHSPSTNYKVYPLKVSHFSSLIKCLVVCILNVFTFMSLWEYMKP